MVGVLGSCYSSPQCHSPSQVKKEDSSLAKSSIHDDKDLKWMEERDRRKLRDIFGLRDPKNGPRIMHLEFLPIFLLRRAYSQRTTAPSTTTTTPGPATVKPSAPPSSSAPPSQNPSTHQANGQSSTPGPATSPSQSWAEPGLTTAHDLSPPPSATEDVIEKLKKVRCHYCVCRYLHKCMDWTA